MTGFLGAARSYYWDARRCVYMGKPVRREEGLVKAGEGTKESLTANAFVLYTAITSYYDLGAAGYSLRRGAWYGMGDYKSLSLFGGCGKVFQQMLWKHMADVILRGYDGRLLVCKVRRKLLVGDLRSREWD